MKDEKLICPWCKKEIADGEGMTGMPTDRGEGKNLVWFHNDCSDQYMVSDKMLMWKGSEWIAVERCEGVQ